MQDVNSKYLNSGIKQINNLVLEDKTEWKIKNHRNKLTDKV